MFLLTLLCHTLAFGQTSSNEVQRTEGDVQLEDASTRLTFDRGYVMDWTDVNESAFTLFSPDGTRLYSTSNAKLGIAKTIIQGLAADTDGTVAGIYETLGEPKLEGRIVLIDPSGKPSLSINTGVYIPTRVCFADDHSIWTVGYEYRKDDFLVFHRFSREGQQLGAFLPWSQIASGHNAYTALPPRVGGGWTLRAGHDRIGTAVSSDLMTTKWIEVGLDGNLIGQWEWKFDEALSYSPEAFTSSGALYGRVWNDHRAVGYALFDPSSKTWKRVKGYAKGRLLGADKDDLVFSQPDGGWTVLHRVASSNMIEIQKTTAEIKSSEAVRPSAWLPKH